MRNDGRKCLRRLIIFVFIYSNIKLCLKLSLSLSLSLARSLSFCNVDENHLFSCSWSFVRNKTYTAERKETKVTHRTRSQKCKLFRKNSHKSLLFSQRSLVCRKCKSTMRLARFARASASRSLRVAWIKREANSNFVVTVLQLPADWIGRYW